MFDNKYSLANSPASILDWGGEYKEFNGKPASPGNEIESIAKVFNCLPPSFKFGNDFDNFAMQSDMNKIK